MKDSISPLGNELNDLLEVINLKFQYDFRNYSRPSLQRRIILALENFNCSSMLDLQEKILNEPDLLFDLLQYLTVGVSEMFRDPAYYRYFREEIIPFLRLHPIIKIWIAGCCTGEEAYSIAIILHEEGLLDRSIIYATDINIQSLEEAKASIFKLERLQKFTVNYQQSGGKTSFSDYYTAAFDAAIFNRFLKNKIIFTDHSLATDHVFSNTHFISCRNVMIYFEKKLQERVIGLFHESLCSNGYLGLAPKETIEYSEYSRQFSTIKDTHTIYQKNETGNIHESH